MNHERRKSLHIVLLGIVCQPGSARHVLLVSGPGDTLLLQQVNNGGDVLWDVIVLDMD